LLPALDEAVQREGDGLATIPGGVELLTVLEVDTHVVDGDVPAGNGLVALSHRDVLGDELGGRGALGHVDLGLLHGFSSWSPGPGLSVGAEPGFRPADALACREL